MIGLIATVFVTSLVGSPHCAGMCGAVVALATCDPQARRPVRLHVAYHGGRLVTYVLLGVVAGAAGALLDFGGPLLGLQRFAAVLAATVMIAFGLMQLGRLAGLRVPTAPLPEPLRRLVMWGHGRALAFPPLHRALTLGLLTTLLPCGWLYVFAIAAAGTASPLWGGLTMAVFWLGTVPILLGLGLGLQQFAGRAGRWPALLGGLALIVIGGYTVVRRVPLTPRMFAPPPALESAVAAQEHVANLADAPLPCCSHDAP